MQNIEDMARQMKNEYIRNWRAANKDKVRATNQRYWQKKAAHQLAAQQAEQENNHADR